MAVFHLNDVPGTTFPAGRLTRVLAGPGAPAEPDNFVMGYVTIYAGGEVPLHAHSQEEVYFIVSGHAIITIDNEASEVHAGGYAYISPGQNHSLRNTTHEELTMVFCYAPKGIVDHWREELGKEEAQLSEGDA